jgi:hypothetical protein
LSVHFHRYISAHHTTLFPHFILRLPSDYTPAARRRATRGRQSHPPLHIAASPPPSQSSDSADTTIPLDSLSSQSSAGGLPLPILSSARRSVAASPLSLPHPAPTASTTRAFSSLAGGATGASQSEPLRPGLRDRPNRVSVRDKWPGL